VDKLKPNKTKPGVNLVNCLRVNLLTLFCKLDHLMKYKQYLWPFMKRSSLQNRVKKFYEIDPWVEVSALYVGMLVCASVITLITKQLNTWAKHSLGYFLSAFALPG
jgi:hypothetical protein